MGAGAVDLAAFIRDIPDFPQPGIVFKDITPLMADAVALDAAVTGLAAYAAPIGVDVVIAAEAGGGRDGPHPPQPRAAGPARRPLGPGVGPVSPAALVAARRPGGGGGRERLHGGPQDREGPQRARRLPLRRAPRA